MLQEPSQKPITRRAFLRAGGALAGAATIGGGVYAALESASSAPPPPGLPSRAVPGGKASWTFRSRADLHPAVVMEHGGAARGEELLFLGPKSGDGVQAGALAVDSAGHPVYFSPIPDGQLAASMRPWRYRREPMLAWWQGKVIAPGYGQGEARMLDSAYRPTPVRAANGRQMDLHEFQITPQGTALFTCYPQTVTSDLRKVGGPRDGRVLESIFQEIDLATGRLLLEWRSLDHVEVTESYHPVSEPWDYLHLNSVDVAPDGNLLVSGRHTWALYKLDRRTGAVIWRLGGKRSGFRLGAGAQFSWQHDGRWPSPGRITVFDDGSDGPTTTERHSRGLALRVDEAARTADVARSYPHPGQPLHTVAMGSVQTLPSGEVLIGWGTSPYASQLRADGSLIADWKMVQGQYSYRAYRFAWRGRPRERPAVALGRQPDGSTTLYASWNGSTETKRWLIEAGPARQALRVVGQARRHGFETAIALPRSATGHVAVTAADAGGRRLGRSRTVKL
jgi:hypothetical protein